jgi:hypothetical protein
VRTRFGEVLNYNKLFYAVQARRSGESAGAVVPIVVDLLHPTSVVDVGCGIGAWVAQFLELGVTDCTGIDGPWVPRGQLRIPEENFLVRDLTEDIDLPRRYDLVTSLEVAEHMSRQYERRFVATLTSLGDVVLFSAAVPHQGGAHHVNEQWQSHWARLFAEEGYEPVDLIRPRIWNNEAVQVWFRQNAILYVSRHRLEADPMLAAEHARTNGAMLSIIHPAFYDSMVLGRVSGMIRPFRDKLAFRYLTQQLRDEAASLTRGKGWNGR